MWIGVIKSFFKFLAITFVALSVTWIMLTRTVGMRVVPAVTGLEEAEAIRVMDRVDLEPSVERKYSPKDAAGMVYWQSPSPNTKVREGRRVRLLVSLGPARATMPDLRGLSLTDAKNRLRTVGEEHNVRGGLTLDMISKTSHPTIPPDHVISHFPPAGQEVTIGDKVQLLISTGPTKAAVIVPNVVGMAQLDAEAELAKVELVVQRATKEISSEDPGTVLRISPEAGTPLNAGDWVTLVVSAPRGPKLSTAPRVVLIHYVVPLLLEPKPFNLVISDRDGPRTIYSGTPNPGKVMEFAERVVGNAELKVYVDGILSKTISYRTR